ncbi:MAG TPA: DNA polymerase III subunit delta [Phycisphaerae bacterium]|nr:DNA polymerase III subunit delta [Phycisphaerae bacterium]
MAQRKPRKDANVKRLSDFTKRKAPGEPLPIYVLRGTDPYLLDKGRCIVRERALGEADPGMALLELDGAGAQLADVLDALRTMPFLAPRRLVLIRDADAFFSPKNQGERKRDAILKYLDEPSPTGVLCLEMAKWITSTKLARRVDEIGLVVQCEADRPNQIPPWLKHQARNLYGKTLTDAAARMLRDYLGSDFAALTHALDMLALFVGDASPIDTPEVDALIARGHHERVWALCDAVAARQAPQALELLDAFWTEGMVAPQVVGLLRTTFRQLVRVRAFAGGMSLDAAMDRAGVPRAAFNRVRRAAAAFSETNLADAYQALVEADLEAKTTPNDRLAMEALVHRLCNPTAARSMAAPSGAAAG